MLCGEFGFTPDLLRRAAFEVVGVVAANRRRVSNTLSFDGLRLILHRWLPPTARPD